ncbi:hypothetical protein SNEBB_003712 [Seison nebaliae]|nr:hypothetical protein SNEBB_003712 [Seison nebaliae]
MDYGLTEKWKSPCDRLVKRDPNHANVYSSLTKKIAALNKVRKDNEDTEEEEPFPSFPNFPDQMEDLNPCNVPITKADTMDVNVKFGADIHTIRTGQHDVEKIADLMLHIKRLTGVNVCDQRLYYRGEILSDTPEKTLTDYKIKHNAMLRLGGCKGYSCSASCCYEDSAEVNRKYEGIVSELKERSKCENTRKIEALRKKMEKHRLAEQRRLLEENQNQFDEDITPLKPIEIHHYNYHKELANINREFNSNFNPNANRGKQTVIDKEQLALNRKLDNLLSKKLPKIGTLMNDNYVTTATTYGNFSNINYRRNDRGEYVPCECEMD